MKTQIRLVIVAVAMTLVAGLVPVMASAAAQEAGVQPVAMVSGAWRLMAWQLVIGSAFPEQGLETRDGNKWAVMIADVTNTGVTGNLPVAEVKLGDAPGDPEMSATVSGKLGLGTISEDGTLMVAENGIARAAIVFDVGGDPQDLTLTLGDQRLPVTSVQSDALNVAGLPTVPGGMQLEVATIQALPTAATLSLTIQQTGEARDVTLAGIQAPPADQCYGQESIQFVNDTTFGTVWVETVPGVDTPTVWYNDAANASFGLLDYALVANGAADADGSGVYGSWLTPIADGVEAQKTGIWANCRSANGDYINPPTPTPIPTPSAEEIRKAYAWVDTRELLTRPFQFEGEKIAVAGEVFNLEVTQEGTFMQIWVDTPNGREAVVVAYPGSQTPGLYEGMWVTAYGVGAGTFEGTNAYGGQISQPVIRADIVDY